MVACGAVRKSGKFIFPKRPIRTSGCLFYDIHDRVVVALLYRVRKEDALNTQVRNIPFRHA